MPDSKIGPLGMKQAVRDKLMELIGSVKQQPVVRAAGVIGDQIGQGFAGNTAQDPDWKVAGMPSPTGQTGLAMKAVKSGAVKAPHQIAADLDRFGYGDLTDAVADSLLRTGPGGHNISEIGVQKMIRSMGYDDATGSIAMEASNNPEYIRGLLGFAIRARGDR